MDIFHAEFEWDAAKREANIRKHGLDLRQGIALLKQRRLYTYASHRGTEARFVGVGRLDGEFVALIWTERPPAIRFISLRRAHRAEERTFRSLHG
jgi:uncharacterized protein